MAAGTSRNFILCRRLLEGVFLASGDLDLVCPYSLATGLLSSRGVFNTASFITADCFDRY